MTTIRINKENEIFNAINELFRDRGLVSDEAYIVSYANIDKMQIKIMLTYGTTFLKIRRENGLEYIFDNLQKQLDERIGKKTNKLTDFDWTGIPEVQENKVHDNKPDCKPVDTRFEEYAKLFEEAQREDDDYEFPELCNDVLMVAKGACENRHIVHLSQLFISNPEIANTLSLFTVYQGCTTAFTYEQACRFVAMTYAHYYGSCFAHNRNLAKIEQHFKNIKSIYEHSYIVISKLK